VLYLVGGMSLLSSIGGVRLGKALYEQKQAKFQLRTQARAHRDYHRLSLEFAIADKRKYNMKTVK